MERRPTIRDVAAVANVSPMTVSRVLNGSSAVRPDTRRRVTEAVAALGYHRNETARALRPGQSSNLVGMTVTNIANPYFGALVVGVESILADSGKRLLLGNSDESQEREQRIVRDLMGRDVEGIIVVPAGGPDHAHLAQAQETGIPVVLATRAIDALALPHVVLADEAASREAVTKLTARGHRRVAFVGWAEGIYTAARRFAGYEAALRAAGIPPDPQLVVPRTTIEDRLIGDIVKQLRSGQPPTAYFAATQREAGAVMRAIRLHAGPTPQELTLACFDHVDWADFSPIPLLVIEHSPMVMGQVAAGMLLGSDSATYRELEPTLREVLPQPLR